MTLTKLRSLLDDFEQAGGQGLEVITGHREPNQIPDTDRSCPSLWVLRFCGFGLSQPRAAVGSAWPCAAIATVLPASVGALVVTATHDVESAGELDFDVVIVGAGASGLMCAIHAGRLGYRVWS